jgi:hypothetical protein
MPILYDWYDKAQAIFYYRLAGNWTLAENVEATAAAHEILQQIPLSQRFDIITDLTESQYSPPSGSLWNWKQSAEVRHTQFPNFGLMVFVNTSRVFNAYFEDGMQTSVAIQRHTRFASNLLEAIKIIQADRASVSAGS